MKALLAILTILLAAPPVHAGRGFWTEITPIRGVLVRSVVADPAAPATLYAIQPIPPLNLFNDGLFRSDDEGHTWNDLGVRNVNAVVVDPFSHATIYATASSAVFRSTDRGDTWTALPLQFMSFTAVDPTEPGVLYSATSAGVPRCSVGSPGGTCSQVAIFQTVDRGDHWTPSFVLSDGMVLHGVEVDPRSGVVYALTSVGTFRSGDRGETWIRATGLPDDAVRLVPHTVTPATLYAVTGSGVFISQDDGLSWERAGELSLAIYDLVIDPDDPLTLYASVDDTATDDTALYRTTDGGESWVRLNDGLGERRFPAHLAFDGAVPRRLYAATYERVFVSGDGGVTWASIAGAAGTPGLLVAPVGNGRLYAWGESVWSMDLPSFDDVSPADFAFAPWIETLVAHGLTSGCDANPPRYCPGQVTTRAAAAVMITQRLLGPGASAHPPTGTVFADVPVSSFAAARIEQLAALGLTSGCGPARYCPEAALRRDHAAVLLLRAVHGRGYSPPSPTGRVFADVPPDHPFAAWIEQLAVERITAGCGAGRYCPGAVVTRAEMAVLLGRAFELPWIDF